MKTPKTARVATAVTHYSDFDLISKHVTTSNFMEFNCAQVLEVVPRQTIKGVDWLSATRLSPMPVPTYGDALVHYRAYFVPYRTIFEPWNEYVNDTTFVNSEGIADFPIIPYFYNSKLKDLLLQPLCSVPHVPDSDPENSREPDFYVYDDEGSPVVARDFTIFGKYVYKTLCSLGYRVYFGPDTGTLQFNALRLLALVRVYFDWFFPSSYVDDERSHRLMRMFKFNDGQTFQDDITSIDLLYLFQELWRVSYDSDYYVSCWDNPVAPNDGAFTPIEMSDITSPNSAEIISDDNGTPIVDVNASNNGTFSQYAIAALRAANDYLTRNRLSGARVLDRYFARWGVQLQAAKMNRSEYLANYSTSIKFGDVTSTADTAGANLGSYSGKGIAGINKQDFLTNFTPDEYGCIVFVHTIVPDADYFQGLDRHVLHMDKLDFYTPEFDSLGVQAMSTTELFMPTGKLSPVDARDGINFDNAVFGFVPRYAEYKKAYNNLTGDIVLPSRNTGKEGWTLMRDVSKYFLNPLTGELKQFDSVVHSQSFVEGSDATQYDRIFYTQNDGFDKFYNYHKFTVRTRFPGRKLYDSYDFKDGDRAQQVEIEINGVKAN